MRYTQLKKAYTNQLGTHVGEECIGESSPEPKESGELLVSANLFKQILLHRPIGCLPVPETNTVMERVTAWSL